LHSERGKQDVGNPGLFGILLENGEQVVLLARSEGVAVQRQRLGERQIDHVIQSDVRRIPASRLVNAAVDPLDRAVGTGGLGRCGSSTISTASVGLNLDEAVETFASAGVSAIARSGDSAVARRAGRGGSGRIGGLGSGGGWTNRCRGRGLGDTALLLTPGAFLQLLLLELVLLTAVRLSMATVLVAGGEADAAGVNGTSMTLEIGLGDNEKRGEGTEA